MAKTISDQDSAIEDYLCDLLSSVEPLKKTSGVSNLSLVQKNVPVDDELATISELIVTNSAEGAERPADVTREVVRKVEVSVPAGAPNWASETFSVYVCSVNNVKLAIPSSCVEQLFEHTADLRELSKSPDWMIGIKMTENGFVAVVDTAALLLKQRLRNESHTQYNQVLLIKNSRWGLAVDSITEKIEVVRSDVNWRQQATTRQWLCGTDSKQQLAVVDTSKLFLDNP